MQSTGESERESQREMVALLRKLGIRDDKILQAFLRVPRALFVPETYRDVAYGNHPIPIGRGQTISQPLIVAMTLEALELDPQDRVLDVGTGSGYQAALLALLAHEVFTVEIDAELLHQAAHRFDLLEMQNVHARIAQTVGWPEAAPFDAIAVGAAASRVPTSLVAQLGVGGRLVIPVGTHDTQELLKVRRTHGRIEVENLGPCIFVPLRGEDASWEGSLEHFGSA